MRQIEMVPGAYQWPPRTQLDQEVSLVHGRQRLVEPHAHHCRSVDHNRDAHLGRQAEQLIEGIICPGGTSLERLFAWTKDGLPSADGDRPRIEIESPQRGLEVRRIPLVVRVQERDVRSSALVDPNVSGMVRAALFRQSDDSERVVPRPLEHRGSSIGRPVVHHDYLERKNRLVEDAIESALDQMSPVVRRDDDAGRPSPERGSCGSIATHRYPSPSSISTIEASSSAVSPPGTLSSTSPSSAS